MSLRNLTAINREWSFDAAQTDTKLIDIGSTQHIEVYYCKVLAANSNTGDASVRIGTGAAGNPTLTINNATGVVGSLSSSGGLAHGGGEVSQMSGAPVLIGAQGDDLYITCSAAPGGSIRIIIQYRIVEDQ